MAVTMTIAPGIDLEASIRLSASMDGMAAALNRESAWRERQARAITRVYFAGSITLSGGAGTDDQPDKLQAKTGYIWGIRRLTAQGYTVGTVTAYRNSSVGEPLIPFPSAAVNTFGKGQILLMPNDRIVWVATTITGTVSYYGEADCIEQWYLPYYLG